MVLGGHKLNLIKSSGVNFQINLNKFFFLSILCIFASIYAIQYILMGYEFNKPFKFLFKALRYQELMILSSIIN